MYEYDSGVKEVKCLLSMGCEMKRLRIAFTGVFDIDNFGDQLFPIIFENQCKKRGVNVETVLFSPIGGKQGFCQNKKVYRIIELADSHAKNPFDAIVVGGGEILHLNSFKHKIDYKSEKFERYPIYDIWITTAQIARKLDIPLLWNNPGCPFEFRNSQIPLVRMVLDSVDYISVRNKFSQKCLCKAFPEKKDKIRLSVDSAFALPYVFPKEELVDVKRKLLTVDKYIVFHSNRFLNDDEQEKTLNVLLRLRDEGFEIVLLPLAYTNADDVFLEKINKKAGRKFINFNGQLSMKEIISILAFCDLYIGVSFHGAIVSAVYGNSVIEHDFFYNKKTLDLFEIMGLEEYYCNDIESVYKKYIDLKENKFIQSVCLEKLEKEVTNHFDNVVKFLMQKEKKGFVLNEYEEFSKWITELSLENQDHLETVRKLSGEAQYNLLNWQKCSNDIKELYYEKERLISENEKLIAERENSIRAKLESFCRKRR